MSSRAILFYDAATEIWPVVNRFIVRLRYDGHHVDVAVDDLVIILRTAFRTNQVRHLTISFLIYGRFRP